MPSELQAVLQQIYNALLQFAIVSLQIALPVLLAYGVRFVHLKVAELRAKLSQEQQYLLDSSVRNIVKSVEANADIIEDKKDEAISLLNSHLKSRGVALPLEELSTAIEAAVWDEFNSPDTGAHALLSLKQ